MSIVGVVMILMLNSVPPSSAQVSISERVAALAKQFDGETGLYARNLISGEEISLNADTRFTTASTIKTAVMLEVYHQAAEGKLRFDDVVTLTDAIKVGGSGVLNGLRAGLPLRISDVVELMIVASDNTATNMLVEQDSVRTDRRSPGRLEAA